MIGLILLCFAFVFFVVAAFREPARHNLTAAGLACYMGYLILGAGHWLK